MRRRNFCEAIFPATLTVHVCTEFGRLQQRIRSAIAAIYPIFQISSRRTASYNQSLIDVFEIEDSETLCNDMMAANSRL